MELKLATYKDLPEIKRMVKEFFLVSPYSLLSFNTEKVDKVITQLLDSEDAVVILLVEGNNTRGVLAGHLSEMIFSSEKIASEIIWWVDERYRSRTSFRMMEAFEWWARKRGCTHVHMSLLGDEMGERLSKIYTRKGYTGSERAYIKEL